MPCNDSPPKHDPDDDVFEMCPVARVEQRFSELQETTTADSTTLSRVLDDLEEQDLITRRLEDRPIATYYDLTKRGEELTGVFEEFEDWAFEHTVAEKPAADRPE
ncbi:hypothetical protein BRC92_04360 [Halobacteriales archaeon QS_4_69_31]|nr:MAG: hypothetical protein BRC92_04360 [Halobacteriales archaeon QS_4_69_31]